MCNKEFYDLFITHFTKYPKMLPNDFFKLIYQNSHGPHHLDSLKLTENFIKELNEIIYKFAKLRCIYE